MPSLLARPRACSLALLALASLAAPLGACGDETNGAGGAPTGDGGAGGQGGPGSGGQGGSGGTSPEGHVFSLAFGSEDNDVPTSIAADKDGNILFGGATRGPVDFGAGPPAAAGSFDALVAKWSPDGKLLWASRLGDAEDQYILGIASDSAGNVVIAGGFEGSMNLGGATLTSAGSSDIFVAKLDPSGKHLWSKTFTGGGDEIAHHLALDAEDNILLTGKFQGTITFGGGALTSMSDADLFVVKLDSTGKNLWSKSFSGTASDNLVNAIAAAPDGGAIIVGDFYEMIDFGGGALTSVDARDAFVARIDGFGDPVWSKSYGGENDQSATGVHVDAGGGVLLTGTFEGTTDFGSGPLTATMGAILAPDIFIAKLDATGNTQWSKGFGDGAAQFSFGIRADSDGNFVVVGNVEGSVDFGGGALTAPEGALADVFVAKFDAGGAPLWSRRYGDAEYQTSAAVALDSGRNVILTGTFMGALDFGGGPLSAPAGEDWMFVAKLEP